MAANWPEVPLDEEHHAHRTASAPRDGYSSPALSRQSSYRSREESHGGGPVYQQGYNDAEAGYTQEGEYANEGSAYRGQAPGEDIVKKLVRLNTTLRRQLEHEGWAPGASDGVLTEEELLEIARAQGLLKRQASRWKMLAIGSVGLIMASFAVMVALVTLGLVLTRQIKVSQEDGVMNSVTSGLIVQAVTAEDGYPLTKWAAIDMTELLHLDRVILASSDGAVFNMMIDTVLADYAGNALLLKSNHNGWIYVANGTLQEVQFDDLVWTPGQTVWKTNNNALHFDAGTRKLLQSTTNQNPPIVINTNGIFERPPTSATPDLLINCGNGAITGIPGCGL